MARTSSKTPTPNRSSYGRAPSIATPLLREARDIQDRRTYLAPVEDAYYDVHVKGSNLRVAAILAAQPDSERDDFARLAFESGVQMQALATANGTVIALGDQLKAAADATTTSMVKLGDGLKTSLNETYGKYLGKDGAFNEQMASAMEAFVTSLDPTKGATARKLLAHIQAEYAQACKTMLADYAKTSKLAVADFAKQLNINDPNTSVGMLHRDNIEMRTLLAKLAEQHAAQTRVDHVRSRTPLKGASLEQWVGAVIAPMAAAREDAFDHCANTEGSIARCKAGDYIHSSDSRRGHSRVAIEAKNQQKTAAAMRHELERICKNRETYATLAITTHLLEPITIHDNVHVVISFPDFGKPDADYALYEKIIMTGLVTAHALARAAAQAPVVESVDFPALQRNVDDLGSTVKLRSQLKGDITRSLTSALKVETSFGLLDTRLDEIMASFTTFLNVESKKVALASKPEPLAMAIG